MSKKTQTTDQPFAAWETPESQADFFGETNLTKEVIKEVTADTEIKTEEDNKPNLPKETPEDNYSFKFGENEDEDEDEDLPPGNTTKGTDTKKDAPTKINNLATLNFLKEKGYVDYQTEEGQELSEDDAENIIEDSWEASIDERAGEMIAGLPTEIKNLIKIATAGGNYREALNNIQNQASTGLSKNSDISKEEVQVLAVTMDLRDQGYDQEYIDTHIEFLKDSGKLATISKKSFDKKIDEWDAESTRIANQATATLQARKDAARAYRKDITAHINELKDVKGIPLNKADKDSLPTYISEPTVELQDGRVISEMQAELFKVMADKDQIVLLAKLLKTKFDFSAIERKKETTVNREVKSDIQRADAKNLRETGVHKSNSKKSLADWLD